jgi:nitrite reductase/ring-hydroxylating ferredoxin subunit
LAAGERLICASGALPEQGRGVRFSVVQGGEDLPAFAIRFQGRVHGYLNRCGHVPVELDYQEGEFFDYSRLYLICYTHGALYDPATGRCLGGRCEGRGLRPLSLEERDGGIYLKDTEHG